MINKPSSKMIFNFLKRNSEQEFTKKQIADALRLSFPAVTGTINYLRDNGYVEENIKTENGSKKAVRYVKITELGKNYE